MLEYRLKIIEIKMAAGLTLTAKDKAFYALYGNHKKMEK